MRKIFERLIKIIRVDTKNLFSKGAIHLLASMILVKALGFPVQVFLARVLGPEYMGHIAVINAVMTFGELFAVMGISGAVLKFVSEPVDEEHKRELLFHGLFIVCFTAVVIAIVVFFIGFFNLIENDVANSYLKILCWTIPFSALSIVMTFNFQALKQITKKAKIDLNIKIISASFFIGGAYFWAFEGYIIARVFITVLTALTVLFIGRRYISFFKIDLSIVKKIVKFGLWGVFAMVTLIVVTTADIICLTTILQDAKIVGYYSIAALLIQLIRMLPKSIMDTAFPYLSEIGEDYSALKAAYWKIFKRMILMMSFVILIAYLFGGLGIKIVFGTNYIHSIAPFNLLLVGLLFSSAGSPAGRTLLALGKINVNFYISFITGGLNILLNIIFITKMGMMGAAVATVITHFVWLTMNQICIYHFLLKK